jgi:hypothetical protein
MSANRYDRMRRARIALLVVLLVVSFCVVYALTIAVRLSHIPSFAVAASTAWSFLVFCFAIALLTMAFVQIGRMLIPVRGWFHGRMLYLWFSRAIEPASDPEAQMGDPNEIQEVWSSLCNRIYPSESERRPSVEKALWQFRQNSSYGRAGKTYIGRLFGRGYPLVYDLPLEQLAAQIVLAAELALDKPREFSDLLLCVVGVEGARDLSTVYPVYPPQSPAVPSGTETAKRTALEDAQARAALARIIQRRSDNFLIEVGGRWRRDLRLVVTACCVTFACLITLSSLGRQTRLIVWGSYFVYAVLGGLLAAFLSMLMRDVSAVIEGRRKQA